MDFLLHVLASHSSASQNDGGFVKILFLTPDITGRVARVVGAVERTKDGWRYLEHSLAINAASNIWARESCLLMLRQRPELAALGLALVVL